MIYNSNQLKMSHKITIVYTLLLLLCTVSFAVAQLETLTNLENFVPFAPFNNVQRNFSNEQEALREVEKYFNQFRNHYNLPSLVMEISMKARYVYLKKTFGTIY